MPTKEDQSDEEYPDFWDEKPNPDEKAKWKESV